MHGAALFLLSISIFETRLGRGLDVLDSVPATHQPMMCRERIQVPPPSCAGFL